MAPHPSYAVFGPLMESNLVERYDIYKRTNINTELQEQQEKSEVLSVDIKVGTRLNAHVGIVHGGIISLLFDTSLGYAPIAYLGEKYNRDLVALTANLKVDFQAPFKEGSSAIIRVFFDRLEGKKKLYFSAILEDADKSVVYAEASSLFILVDPKKVGH